MAAIFDTLPNDPVILLSFVNTQLRDNFAALDALCEHYGVERRELEAKLGALDYAYDAGQNRFV